MQDCLPQVSVNLTRVFGGFCQTYISIRITSAISELIPKNISDRTQSVSIHILNRARRNRKAGCKKATDRGFPIILRMIIPWNTKYH